MFVRIKETPNSPKKSVQIVHSTRTGKKVSQRIVRHIGTALAEDELKRLVELAEYVKAKLEEESQPNLFNPEEMALIAIEARKQTDDKPIKVNLKDLREESRVILGIHEVYGQMYEELGFSRVISNPKRHVAASKSLFNIVMARIANPASKRKSVIELERDFGIKLSLEGVYNMMDDLEEERIEHLQKISYNAARGILGERLQVVFYDCTTLYFESFREDELKKNGYSKDMKFNQPQVLLAILTTEEGLPVGYEIYAGSTFEGNTLIDAIARIEEKYSIERVIFVADSAMISQKNTEILEKSGKTGYIVGARLKNLPGWIKEKITDKENYEEYTGGKVRQIELGEGKRLIVTYSYARAEKDSHDRMKTIEKLRKKIEKSDNPQMMISNFGYKKYLKIEGGSKVRIDEEKLAEASRWDGLHGIITNVGDITNEEALDQYHKLWQIEETFRISKNDLEIRPIYHWTPGRIKAHIAICFMALVLIRHLEYRVKTQYEKLSPEVIKNELLHVQCSILLDQKTGKRYGVPSSVTQHIRKIYQIMGKKIDNIPFEIK